MTTIVKHRRTGNEYILLGINGEAHKANPSRFISELFNQEKSEVSCSATVCDVQGNIFLAYIDDLVVIEIDGIKPAEILPEATYKSVNDSWRSRSASVEGVQSSSPNFEEEDFEEEDFEEDLEEEDERDREADLKPAAPTSPVVVVDSMDAPNQDRGSDDEDWI